MARFGGARRPSDRAGRIGEILLQARLPLASTPPRRWRRQAGHGGLGSVRHTAEHNQERESPRSILRPPGRSRDSAGRDRTQDVLTVALADPVNARCCRTSLSPPAAKSSAWLMTRPDPTGPRALLISIPRGRPAPPGTMSNLFKELQHQGGKARSRGKQGAASCIWPCPRSRPHRWSSAELTSFYHAHSADTQALPDKIHLEAFRHDFKISAGVDGFAVEPSAILHPPPHLPRRLIARVKVFAEPSTVAETRLRSTDAIELGWSAAGRSTCQLGRCRRCSVSHGYAIPRPLVVSLDLENPRSGSSRRRPSAQVHRSSAARHRAGEPTDRSGRPRHCHTRC